MRYSAIGLLLLLFSMPSPAKAGELGAQRVLLMLLDYTDQGHAIRSTSGLAEIAEQTRAYYAAASYGLLSLELDAIGPLTIPVATPPAGSGCDRLGYANLADTAAIQAGTDPSLYRHKVYLLPPSPGCNAWAGFSTIGGNPSKTWLNGTTFVGLVIHELGHSLGLYDSHALYCRASTGAGADIPPAALLSQCVEQQYGDRQDVMGDAAGMRHFNAAQKDRLGWLAPELATNGVYTLTPLETTPRALVIDRAPGALGALYVEHRATLSDEPWGVLVHLVLSPDEIYLLDMTPSPELTKHAMLAGQTWTDPASGVWLSVLSSTAAGSTVEVGSGATPLPPPADRDGDGVPDAADLCPDVKGSASTGCPTAPPAPVGVVLTLTKVPPPGREMTFGGALAGATNLQAFMDGQPLAARYVVVDGKRKTWSAKTQGLVKGPHTFSAILPGTTASVSVSFAVLK